MGRNGARPQRDGLNNNPGAPGLLFLETWVGSPIIKLTARRKEAIMTILTNQRTSAPCQCLRTKNPYGTTPQNFEDWLPHVATS